MMQIEIPIPQTQMVCDEDDDLTNLCRLCAHSSDLLVPIYEGEGLKTQLADKIASYLPVQIRQTDPLPVHLCYKCATLVLSWHELVTSCVEADRRLRIICQSHINGVHKNQTVDKHKGVEMSVESNVEAVDKERPGPSGDHLKDPSHPSDCEALKHQESGTSSHMQQQHQQQHQQQQQPQQQQQQQQRPVPGQERYVIQKTQKTLNDLAEDLSVGAMVPQHHMPATASTKYPCQQCGRPFARRYDMQRHVRAVHRTGVNDGEASCDICGKTFSRANDAKRHRERVHPVNEAGVPLKREKNHVCSVCNNAFTRKNDLKRHLLKTHAVVMNETDFRQHYRMMQVDGSHVKRDEDAERLQKAAVTVDGRTYYQCDVCSKSLHQPYLFLRHYRIHTGELPFTCDICSKSFRLSASLIRHKKDVHLRRKGEQQPPPAHPPEHKNIWDICWEGLHTVPPGLYYH